MCARVCACVYVCMCVFVCMCAHAHEKECLSVWCLCICACKWVYLCLCTQTRKSVVCQDSSVTFCLSELGCLLEPRAHFSCLGWKPASPSNLPGPILLGPGITGVLRCPTCYVGDKTHQFWDLNFNPCDHTVSTFSHGVSSVAQKTWFLITSWCYLIRALER